MKFKNRRKTCVACRQHKAISRIFGGGARFDRHRPLCPRCFRAALDALAARLQKGAFC